MLTGLWSAVGRQLKPLSSFLFPQIASLHISMVTDAIYSFCGLLRVKSFSTMERISGEQVPCLSAAESDTSPSDQSHTGSYKPLHTRRRKARRGHSYMFPNSDNRSTPRHDMGPSSESSDIAGFDGDITSQPWDYSMPAPRTLSFSWSSFVTDAISVLSTVPFIVLACLLARANGEPVHQAAHQSFENGIRVVSVLYPEALF